MTGKFNKSLLFQETRQILIVVILLQIKFIPKIKEGEWNELLTYKLN